MGINPSNRLNEGLKGFPTLGDPPFSVACKDQAVAELRAAGVPRGSETITMMEREIYKEGARPVQLANAGISMPGMSTPEDVEWAWLYKVEADFGYWKFRRAWYYWVVYTEDDAYEYDIPTQTAWDFNERLGREARAEGFAGGTDVNGPVSFYHVDTPRGLAELVKIIKQQYDDVEAEHEKIRSRM